MNTYFIYGEGEGHMYKKNVKKKSEKQKMIKSMTMYDKNDST